MLPCRGRPASDSVLRPIGSLLGFSQQLQACSAGAAVASAHLPCCHVALPFDNYQPEYVNRKSNGAAATLPVTKASDRRDPERAAPLSSRW